jgi:hypothetical protein
MKKYIGGHKVDQSGTKDNKFWTFASGDYDFTPFYMDTDLAIPNSTIEVETDDLSIRLGDIVSIDRDMKAVRTQNGGVPIGRVRGINVTPDRAVVTVERHTQGIIGIQTTQEGYEDLMQRRSLIHSALEWRRRG